MDGFLREDEWAECLGCAGWIADILLKNVSTLSLAIDNNNFTASGCHRPCQVFKSERKDKDRNTRFVQSIVQCQEDGTCAKKQCERQFGRHKLCWYVNRSNQQCRDLNIVSGIGFGVQCTLATLCS